MWPFGKSKTNPRQEMTEYLKKFMLDYIKENAEDADDVVPIFSDAEVGIRKLPEKELNKSLKQNHITIEFAVLNIVQNCAMVSIKPQAAKDFLMRSITGNHDSAYDLYHYVNDIKLKKGYISKEQYEENKLLAVKLSMKSPLGQWY